MNKPSFRIRTASNQDTEQITALIKKILSEFKLIYSPESSEEDLQQIEETYLRNGGNFEVVENENGEIIGTIGLLNLRYGKGKIRKLYVDKRYRKSGVGALLLKRTLSAAEKLGFTEITLETVQRMTAAIHLYEKYGFKKLEGQKPTSPRCDLVMSRTVNDESR